MITLRHVLQARDRISRSIVRTPVVKSDFLSDLTGATVYLKLECLQKLNSFKIRGAMNKGLSLTSDERAKGIVAASSGNHGAAVSYVANTLGIGADVFVPRGTPEAKVEKIRRYGAALHIEGNNYDEAHALALVYVKKTGKVYLDPTSDETVVAGHGTIGLELVEDAPTIDAIVVPIGGGGLITGISIAARSLKPSVSVIGVQTEACPAMVAALRDKVFYEDYPSRPSVCDAVVGGLGRLGYENAERCIHSVVTASEAGVKQAVVELVRRDKVVAEPSGALGVAYLAEGGDRFRGMTVVVVVSGGNVDFDFLRAEIQAYSEKQRNWG